MKVEDIKTIGNFLFSLVVVNFALEVFVFFQSRLNFFFTFKIF